MQRGTDVGRVGVGDAALFNGLLIPRPPMRAGKLSISLSLSFTSRFSRERMKLKRITSSRGWKMGHIGHRPTQESPLALKALSESCKRRMRLSGSDFFTAEIQLSTLCCSAPTASGTLVPVTDITA